MYKTAQPITLLVLVRHKHKIKTAIFNFLRTMEQEHTHMKSVLTTLLYYLIGKISFLNRELHNFLCLTRNASKLETLLPTNN